MRYRLLPFVSLVAFAAAPLATHAQVYKLHQVDLGLNATGPFTRVLTSDSPNRQFTTDTTGFLFSLKEHPVSWAGVEFNYGYNQYTNVFRNHFGASARVKTVNHEATAAYLFHPHIRHLQPFVAVGGGAIDFVPTGQAVANQWRGAGLVEVGLDIPTKNPHLGFRAMGRSLIYRAPNFNTPLISTESWVATVEPAGGVYFRF